MWGTLARVRTGLGPATWVRHPVLKVRSSTVTIFAVRLEPSVTLGAAHLLAASLQRFGNSNGCPTALPIPHLAFVNRLVHDELIARLAPRLQPHFQTDPLPVSASGCEWQKIAHSRIAVAARQHDFLIAVG